ncbi:MAG TPA: hypothetical protein DCO77_06065 [Nitrospiraceae bacterium]|nr:hypothetical protein [Nitrospiraceae bacterium]
MDKPHKKLDVWKLSIDLVVEIYKLTQLLPHEEKYNLISQMKRAVISIPGNIAEGAARNTKKEFIHFLHIAQGSLSELDTHLDVVRRLKFLQDQDFHFTDGLMERIDKMLTGLIRHEKSAHALRLTSDDRKRSMHGNSNNRR